MRNPPLQQCQKPDSETYGGASSSGSDGTTCWPIKPPKASVMKVILRVIIGNINFIKIRNWRLCRGDENGQQCTNQHPPWLSSVWDWTSSSGLIPRSPSWNSFSTSLAVAKVTAINPLFVYYLFDQRNFYPSLIFFFKMCLFIVYIFLNKVAQFTFGLQADAIKKQSYLNVWHFALVK